MDQRSKTPGDFTHRPAGYTPCTRTPRRGKRSASLLGERGIFPRPGNASLPGNAARAEPRLATEEAASCAAQVLVGETWIAARSAPRATDADAGKRVLLEPGTRFSIRACCDIVTIVVTTPSLAHDVGFSLQQRDGMRVLTVTSGSGRLPASRPSPGRSLAAARATTP